MDAGGGMHGRRLFGWSEASRLGDSGPRDRWREDSGRLAAAAELQS